MKELLDIEVLALNSLCETINNWATDKGWNETPDSVSFKAEQIALMHSELSECLEYVRMKPTLRCPLCANEAFDHKPQYGGDNRVYVCNLCQQRFSSPEVQAPLDNHIPIPGEHAELADLAIRLFHYCGRRGINLGEAVRLKHAYNINRPYRHDKNI